MSTKTSILNCHSVSLVARFRCILFLILNADEKTYALHVIVLGMHYAILNKETRFPKATDNYLFRSRTNWCDGIFSCLEQHQNKECGAAFEFRWNFGYCFYI